MSGYRRSSRSRWARNKASRKSRSITARSPKESNSLCRKNNMDLFPKKKKKDEELKKFVPPFVLPLHYIPFLSSSISLLTEKPGREREKVKETPQSEKTYVCLEKAQCPMLRSSWRRVVPKPFLHHPHCMRSSVLLSLCSIFILENEIKSG